MKKTIEFISFMFLMLLASGCTNEKQLTQAPPLGWNSFDSYGVYLNEKAALANVDAFVEKLKPYGYEYFVIDACWFGEFEIDKETLYPKEKTAHDLNINEFGLLQPSKTYFPNGLKPVIDRCHQAGIKFGLHLMRGIPRKAVKLDLPVKGTEYTARDIADTSDICVWCPENYGIDMTRPGAQEFYNSLINQMADWGVDFIKYDDIVPHPEEVQAVVNAIRQCGRPIVLSLSPGGKVIDSAIDIYKQADMLRVTGDVWDKQKDIDKCFDAWKKWQDTGEKGFWIDLDMIPFGQLRVIAPKPDGLTGDETSEEIEEMIEDGKVDANILYAGEGWKRWCRLTRPQMQTFISMRALSASPLFVGGDLPTMDGYSLSLLTNKELLKCNQNGVIGKLVYSSGDCEIWKTPEAGSDGGWIGIFNRSGSTKQYDLTPENLGFSRGTGYKMHDIFNDKAVCGLDFQIEPNGVIFLKYSRDE